MIGCRRQTMTGIAFYRLLVLCQFIYNNNTSYMFVFLSAFHHRRSNPPLEGQYKAILKGQVAQEKLKRAFCQTSSQRWRQNGVFFITFFLFSHSHFSTTHAHGDLPHMLKLHHHLPLCWSMCILGGQFDVNPQMADLPFKGIVAEHTWRFQCTCQRWIHWGNHAFCWWELMTGPKIHKGNNKSDSKHKIQYWRL